MCQLFGVSASVPLKLSFSWQHFALRGAEEFGNPDGWGVAYMDGTEAHIVREPVPAMDSPFVTFLAEYGPMSSLTVSHVRRASVGGRRLANTHPFVRRLGGRVHVFAHNGFVPLDAGDLLEPWLRPTGDTDSEVMFCRLLADLEPLWQGAAPPSLDARTAVVASFAARMRNLGVSSFLYSDGLTLFAHAHRKTVPGEAITSGPGLYLLERVEMPGGLCSGLWCRGDCSETAVVATIPLDEQPWQPLPEGELLRIEHGALL